MADQPHFLNVACSATGRAWQERCSAVQRHAAMAVAQKYGMEDIVARVLAGRGVTIDEAQDFLKPTLRTLMPNPASFTDMEKAAARLVQAIEHHEQIAIFGDYDVDGACSTAMLKDFFVAFGLAPRLYIPDRLIEGYGPNVPAMQMLAREGASLIITVDCGSLSDAPIAAACKEGAEVIVLDHHQMGDRLPDAAYAVVNPNRQDDLSHHGFLCAAGVVFITLAAVLRQLRARSTKDNLPDLLKFLDLVALATICDVVPLVGVNRAFVVQGLHVTRRQHRPGLAALIKAARIAEPVNNFHLGFVLGPRINAGGRIGNPALGSDLLSCRDPQQCETIAAELEALNNTRQAIEAQSLQEAETQAARDLEQCGEMPILVVASPDWHPGIIGLLAARLKERYHRPSIVLSIKGDGTANGSARSISGFDIGALIGKAVMYGLLDKGGGHAMAAGLSMKETDIEKFRQWCMTEVSDRIGTLARREPLLLDGLLSSSGASVELCEKLEQAGPFGAGHELPIFALPAHRLIDVREVSKGHIAATLANSEGKRLKAIAFRAIGSDLGDFLFANRGHPIHSAGSLSVNHWNGRATPQLRLVDAAEVSPPKG